MPETILIGLAEWALRATALAGLVGLLLLALRIKDVSLRLAAWTAVLAGALLIPLAAVVMPQLLISVPKPSRPAPPAARVGDFAGSPPPRVLSAGPASSPKIQPGAGTQTRETPFQRTLKWPVLLFGLWLLVAVTMLFRLALGLFLSRRLRRASAQISDGVHESDAMRVPVTVGVIHPVILLPPDWRSWEEWKLQAVLAHEQAHVRNRDPLRQVVASVYRSLCWFSPLAWWLSAQLADLAEATSDDAALLAAPDRIQYAQALLEFFERTSRRVLWQGIAMAKKGTATKRIDRILDSRRRLSGFITRRVLLMLTVAAVPLIYAVSSLHPVWAAAAQSVASAVPSSPTWQNLKAALQPVPIPSRDPNAVSPSKPLVNQIPPAPIHPRLEPAAETPSLPAPQQLEPQNGAAWSEQTFPRTVNFQWSRVPGAASYGIEINCFHCCVQRQWCSDAGGTTHIVRGLVEPNYTHDYVGSQPGSWRVWAIDENSNDGVASGWSEFTFSAPNDLLRLPPLPSNTAPPAKHPALFPAPPDEYPKAIYAPYPDYTDAARKTNISGTLVLNVTVGPDGLVKDVSVRRGLTPDLDESAMRTVRIWRFEPARRNGVAVAAVVSVEVDVNSKSKPLPVTPDASSSPGFGPPPENVPVGGKPPLSVETYIAPKPIYTPEPSYTDAARKANISGTVMLNLTVGADGLVKNVSVERSLVPDLDESAMRTVRTWRFEPARRSGLAALTTMHVEVGFYLPTR